MIFLLNIFNIIFYICLLLIIVKLVKVIRKNRYRQAKLIGIIILIIVIFVSTFIVIDVKRLKMEKEPICSIPITYLKDGGTTQYAGIGYSLWKINSLASEKEMRGMMKGYKVEVLYITIKEDYKFVPDANEN